MRTLLTLFLLCLELAQAHGLDMNRAAVTLEGSKAVVEITPPSSIFRAFDDDQNGLISVGEVKHHREAMTQLLSEQIRLVNEAGDAGRLGLNDIVVPYAYEGMPQGSDHVRILRHYEWAEAPEQVTFRYGLLEGGQKLSTVIGNGEKNDTVILSAAEPEYTYGAKPAPTLWQFVVLGVEHILTGYDHLLFLLALILAAGSLMNLLRVITAFTVAHSITIALTVLGIVSVPSYLVEGVIALSIAWVALENLFKPKASPWRWLVVFAFGLVHGMGFAGVLQEIGLPQGQALPSILSFNIGVELGQIAFVLAVSGLLTLVQRVRVDLVPIQRWGSVVVAAMAVYWSVERFFA